MTHKIAESIPAERTDKIQIEKNQGAIHLLQSWMEDAADEEEGSLEELKQAVDQSRLIGRKHFE